MSYKKDFLVKLRILHLNALYLLPDLSWFISLSADTIMVWAIWEKQEELISLSRRIEREVNRSSIRVFSSWTYFITRQFKEANDVICMYICSKHFFRCLFFFQWEKCHFFSSFFSYMYMQQNKISIIRDHVMLTELLTVITWDTIHIHL